MFGRYSNATARAQQKQGCFTKESEPEAKGTHQRSVLQHLLSRVVIMSSPDSPRKGKRVTQVQDPSRASRQEQQKVGLETGLGDEASAEVQSPSRRQGSRQVHLQYSSGKDRRAQPSGAWMELLDQREERAWVEVAGEAAQGTEDCGS